MPTFSRHPPLSLPEVDLFSFFFEHQVNTFPEDKGMA